MANQIVTVNVSQQAAPAPSLLQQTGALLSQGGTNTAQGTASLLTQASDLTAILKGPLAVTSMVWSASVVTVTTAAPHGFTLASVVPVTIAGVTPAGYNGNYSATVTGASTFTYPLGANPGAVTVQGTYVAQSAAELLAMVTTFFGQGTSRSVYVLELGPGSAANGVSYLTTFMTANPNAFYSYLVPRSWGSESTFVTYVSNFLALSSRQYFFVTVTEANRASFTAAMKSVFAFEEATVGVAATEFGAAWPFWVGLHYAPSSTNKVTPTAFTFGFGITLFPVLNNNALLATLKSTFVNIAGIAAEGGLSNTILFWGTNKDGNDFTYWYSVDWVQTTLDLNMANAIINGSNNSVNPLYYNQNGIDRLQAVGVKTLADGVGGGLVLGTVIQTSLTAALFQEALARGDYAGKAVINAIPFIPYSADHPNDYAVGLYSGFTVAFVPQRGFKAIVINLLVSNFVAQ